MWGWAFKMNSRFSSSSSAANTCSTEIDTSEPGWKRQNIQYQLKKYCKNIYTVLWKICTWPHWACLMCIYIYKHHVDFLLICVQYIRIYYLDMEIVYIYRNEQQKWWTIFYPHPFNYLNLKARTHKNQAFEVQPTIWWKMFKMNTF